MWNACQPKHLNWFSTSQNCAPSYLPQRSAWKLQSLPPRRKKGTWLRTAWPRSNSTSLCTSTPFSLTIISRVVCSTKTAPPRSTKLEKSRYICATSYSAMRVWSTPARSSTKGQGLRLALSSLDSSLTPCRWRYWTLRGSRAWKEQTTWKTLLSSLTTGWLMTLKITASLASSG